MRFQLPFLVILLAFSVPVFATAPHMDISVEIKRASEFKLSKKQTAVIDEASKLSAACRTFYGLYDRWPTSLVEIEGRTEGINFSKFNGKAGLEIVPEGLVITIFDTKFERKMLATSGAPSTSEARALAQDPRFRIRVTLNPVQGF
jgi:hypothetical protein